jgi:predicted short-subunit dehydrogenase-like oxidoreductase (DUF2520 family)
MGGAEFSGYHTLDVPDAVLFCVPEEAYDQAFLSVCAPGLPLDVPFLVSSGFLPLDSLQPHGHPVGRMHPAFAFPHSLVPLTCMEDLCFLITGPPECLRAAQALVVGSSPALVHCTQEHHELYHAACVTASNLAAGLGTMAEDLFGGAGIELEGAHRLIRSLMGGVLRQGVQAGFRATITGPAARKDSEVVIRETRSFPADMQLEARWFNLGNQLVGHQLGHEEFVAELRGRAGGK